MGDEQDIYLARVKWMKESKVLTYQIQNRSQQYLALKAFNLSNNNQTSLVEEKSNTWVNLYED